MGNRFLTSLIIGLACLGFGQVSSSEDRRLEEQIRSSVETDPGEGFFKTGNGFFAADGAFIVTAAHIVGGCRQFRYNMPNRDDERASLVMWDGRRDLALLRPETPNSTGLRIDTSTRPATSDADIYSMRFGLDAPTYPERRTVGLTQKYFPFGPSHFLILEDKLDIGASGSPMIGSDGNVIGMVSARMTLEGRDISVALPGDEIGIALQDALSPDASLNGNQDSAETTTITNSVVRIRCS